VAFFFFCLFGVCVPSRFFFKKALGFVQRWCQRSKMSQQKYLVEDRDGVSNATLSVEGLKFSTLCCFQRDRRAQFCRSG
jgi:hypothetical protein